MFERKDNNDSVVTSDMQFAGIKPSIMSSGDTNAKQEARYFIKCNTITCPNFSSALFSTQILV